MISLTRLDGRVFYLNCDLIDFFECTPDTVITLRNDRRMLVKETVEQVYQKIIEYKQKIYLNPFSIENKRVKVNTDNETILDILNKDIKKLKDEDYFKDIKLDDEEDDD